LGRRSTRRGNISICRSLTIIYRSLIRDHRRSIYNKSCSSLTSIYGSLIKRGGLISSITLSGSLSLTSIYRNLRRRLSITLGRRST
jgi:hypothetical protein